MPLKNEKGEAIAKNNFRKVNQKDKSKLLKDMKRN